MSRKLGALQSKERHQTATRPFFLAMPNEHTPRCGGTIPLMDNRTRKAHLKPDPSKCREKNLWSVGHVGIDGRYPVCQPHGRRPAFGRRRLADGGDHCGNLGRHIASWRAGLERRHCAWALLLTVLANGSVLMNVSGFWQRVIVGAVVLVAVLVDLLRRRAK